MSRATRMAQIMAHEQAGGHAKFVGDNGRGVRVYCENGRYTVYHIEDNGRSYNPTPLVSGTDTQGAARFAHGLATRIHGRRVTTAQRRPLDEIIYGQGGK